MKFNTGVILLIIFGLSGCASNTPKELAPGMARIEVIKEHYMPYTATVSTAHMSSTQEKGVKSSNM